MELRQLRYFVTLAEELHFARAARRLNIVQPALSMQIRCLEEKLGVDLFARNRRTVELTQAGRLLFVEAGRILEQAERARDIVSRATSGMQGRVRIGYSPSAACSGLLGKAVRCFQHEAPNVELVVHDIYPHGQYAALASRQFDAVLGPTLPQLATKGIDETLLAAFPASIALRKDHRLAGKDPVDTGCLREEVFVGYAGPGDPEGGFLTRQIMGFEPRFGCRASNPFMMLSLVEAGLGIAVVSSAVENSFKLDLCYRRLRGDPPPVIDVTLISRKAETEPAVLAFVNMVRRNLSSTQDHSRPSGSRE